MKTFDYLDELVPALTEQLKQDDVSWGDTWLKRTREGQEERTWNTYKDYFDRYFNAGVPIPWLKVIGGAFICWLRERHPEIWEK